MIETWIIPIREGFITVKGGSPDEALAYVEFKGYEVTGDVIEPQEILQIIDR